MDILLQPCAGTKRGGRVIMQVTARREMVGNNLKRDEGDIANKKEF